MKREDHRSCKWEKNIGRMLSVDELADVLKTSKPSNTNGGIADPKSLQIKEIDHKADTWSSLF